MNKKDHKAFEAWWRTTDELGRYTEQQETWQAALAYERNRMAETEPVAWLVEPTKGVAHIALGKDVVLVQPVNKSDWKITPLIIRPSKEQPQTNKEI